MRTGAHLRTKKHSVVATQHALAVIIGRMAPAIAVLTAIAVDRRPGDAGAVIIVIARIGIAHHRALLIGRVRREAARAGIGRSLVDVVVLRGWLSQPLIGCAITVAGDAVATTRAASIRCLIGINRRWIGVGLIAIGRRAARRV